MELEPGSLIGNHGITDGVSLVEGVVGEIVDLVIDALCDIGGDAVGDAAHNIAGGIAVDEGTPLLLDILGLLLTHGAAHHIRLSQGVARQAAEDLDNLLLIDDAAVGNGEDGLQGGVLIGDEPGVVLTGDEPGNGIHGAGAVEGHDSSDILNGLGLQPHADTGHAGRFHLENAARFALGEHLKDTGIVIRHIGQGKIRLSAANHLHRILQNSEVAKAQKVHF